eukprot:jgi/Astpho2/3035/Aster-03343
MAFTSSLAQEGSLVDNLLHFLADEGPSGLLEGYVKLGTWVDNTLDLYKCELERVLYPVFIHCYLDLVGSRVAAGEAQKFMTENKHRFVEAGNQSSNRRQQEIQDLSSVSVPEHIDANRTARAAQEQRYPVKLTQYGLHLLMHFLQSAKLFQILSIVNRRVDIQVTDGFGKPADGVDGSAEISLLLGAQHIEMQTVNTKPLMLSLLQDSPEDKYAELKAEEAAAEVPTHDADGKQLTKKQQGQERKRAEKERAEAKKHAAAKMHPQIPMLPLPDELQAAMMSSIDARAELSPEDLPSAVLYTFVNTHKSLHCATTSEDGTLVAGGFADSSVRVFDVASQNSNVADGAAPGMALEGGATMLWGHSAAVNAVDFSPDLRLLFSASVDGTIRLWSLGLAANLVAYRAHMFPVWDVASCPHGLYFASGSADRTARLWSTERAQPLRILAGDNCKELIGARRRAGHQADVDVVRWHPNSHYVASGSTDSSIRLWDVRSGKASRICLGHRAPITALAFSPDGQTLLSGSEDGSMAAWDLGSARRLASMHGHRSAVWSLAFSHGAGSLLASGSADQTVRLWSSKLPETLAAEGTPLLKTLKTKATPVFHVHFMRTNLLMAAGALTLGSGAVAAHLGIGEQAGPILLVTAHPDDESLFFGPTITALRNAQQEVFLLCMTTGNAHGQGNLRRLELLEATRHFDIAQERVHLVNNTGLQDGHDVEWNITLVREIISEEARSRRAGTIISFDGAGVTGHKNHMAISSAVQQLVESCGGAEDCPAAWKLISAGSWQKYTSMLDALPAGPQRESVQTACYLNRGLVRSFRAFGAHWSQRRWWKHFLFSRYTFINILQRVSRQSLTWPSPLERHL